MNRFASIYYNFTLTYLGLFSLRQQVDWLIDMLLFEQILIGQTKYYFHNERITISIAFGGEEERLALKELVQLTK